MARRSCFLSVFLMFFPAMLQLSASSLSKVMAQTNKSMGTFILIDGGKYTLNFTEARAACLFLNVTIATKAQVEEAVQHGLETCKFGWVAEKIAVIPRIQSDKNCGAGKTGLVLWYAPVEKNLRCSASMLQLTDQLQTSKPTTASPQSSRSSNFLLALTSASTSAAPTFRSPTQSLPSVEKPVTPLPTKQAPSASAPLTKTTDSSLSSSSSSPVKHLPSNIPVSPHGHLTSIPTGVTVGFSTTKQPSSSSVSSEPGLKQSVSSANPPLDAAHITVISLSFILLLLTAATAWWCYKSNIVFWCVRHHKGDLETEMWRNTHSEMDLHSEDGAEPEHDEELSMKPDMLHETLQTESICKLHTNEEEASLRLERGR